MEQSKQGTGSSDQRYQLRTPRCAGLQLLHPMTMETSPQHLHILPG